MVSLGKPSSRIKFRDIDQADENTQIEELTMLQFSYFKSFVLAPILGVCTGLIFLLCLYWYESLQARFLYTEVWDLKRATHIRVTGKSKNFILKILYQRGMLRSLSYKISKFSFKAFPHCSRASTQLRSLCW